MQNLGENKVEQPSGLLHFFRWCMLTVPVIGPEMLEGIIL